MPLVWTKQICDELRIRIERDQQARQALTPFFARSTNGKLTGSDPDEKAAMDSLREVDRDNTAWLKGLVEELGWPLRYEVGDDCAFNAWLLVQHADHDVEFQRRSLDLMRAAPEGAVDLRTSPICATACCSPKASAALRHAGRAGGRCLPAMFAGQSRRCRCPETGCRTGTAGELSRGVRGIHRVETVKLHGCNSQLDL